MSKLPVQPNSGQSPAVPRSRAPRRWEAMRARAERLRWRVVARPRRPIRLWVPVTPLVILFSPLILLFLGIAVLLPRPFGVNPAEVVLGVGRFLASLNGTQADAEGEDRSVQIKLF